MEELNGFLRRGKTLWDAQSASSLAALDGTEFLFCIGNEALDLDSAVCSIVGAYVIAQTKVTSVALPVLNVLREDFRLRTETTFLFRTIGLDLDSLIFLDDIQAEARSYSLRSLFIRFPSVTSDFYAAFTNIRAAESIGARSGGPQRADRSLGEIHSHSLLYIGSPRGCIYASHSKSHDGCPDLERNNAPLLVRFADLRVRPARVPNQGERRHRYPSIRRHPGR